jgi:ABC-2 type transport system ATP-binding protein
MRHVTAMVVHMSESIVTTRDLTKKYGPRAAVDAVSLTVRRGEVYGFLGPNGAGKTTTLRILLGLIQPSSGSATVLGHEPGSRGALARVGALVEEPGFYPYLSGRDNLRVMARYAGLDDVAVAAALEQVDLSDRAGDKFKSYSLGMKQRLGVAAALLGEPELLVLDEPTNGLDPAGMSDMRDLVRSLAAAGQTVMLSSHLLGEVQEICDRVGVISNGHLITESTVDDLRGSSSLLLRAAPLDVATAISRETVGAEHVTVNGDGEVHLDVAPSRAPEVARALINADVDIHEIRPQERALEDVFLEITSTQEATS